MMWPLVRHARYLGRYRQIISVLVHHGFGYLVAQLGLASLATLPQRILSRRAPPPPPAAAERLRLAMIDLGPTFVKLGQILSTRSDLLPPEFITELDKLQDTVPAFPAAIAVGTIESELGRPVSELFRSFTSEPLAAASLGQVHAAVLHSGEHVVVKVQRPDISGVVATDLAIIADLAALAQERTTLGARYNLNELVWELSATLRGELDYRREGRNADRFRRNFAANPFIHIPTIYWDYCSSRVLTSERLCGVKINDISTLDAQGYDRRVLAQNCTNLILEEIFSHGFFHGDPHPGNFFALPGNIVGAVDFGQVGILDHETTRNLLLMLSAVTNRNATGVLRALERLDILAWQDINPSLRRDVERLSDRFVDRRLADISLNETIDDLVALLQRHHLRLPAPMASLLKALVMMEGIGIQLDPNLDVFSIARPYAQRAMAEQFAPDAISERLLEQGRALSEATLELPLQLNELVRRLNDGEMHIQTREQEMRRLAGALIGAANRVSVALVFAALVLGMGMLALAVGLGGWSGALPATLWIVGSIGLLINGLLLWFALLRGRDV